MTISKKNIYQDSHKAKIVTYKSIYYQRTNRPINQLTDKSTKQRRGTPGHTQMHANLIIKMYKSLADFRLTRIGFSSPIQKI